MRGTRHAADVERPRRSVGVPTSLAWAAIAILLPASIALFGRMSAVDLAYHVRLGDQMLRTGELVRADDMTFSVPGRAWLDQQWGAQIVLAATHRLGDWPALATLRAALIVLILASVFLACRRRGASAMTASFLTVAAFLLAAPGLEMRPQLFSAVLFAASVLILAVRHDRPRLLWLLPVLTVAWANLHGSFPLVLLLLGLALIEDRADREAVRRLAIVGGFAAVATIVTPLGVDTWRYVIDLSTHPVVRNAVSEWEPMSLAGYPGYAFFASVIVVGALLGRRGQSTSLVDLLTLAAFFVIALPAMRGMLWWGLAAPVVVAGWFGTRRPAPDRRGPVEALVVVSCASLLVIALPFWRYPDEASQVQGLLREAPQGATQAAKEILEPGDRVVVDQPWASWFEYEARDLPVFVDPRIELFPEDVWEDYAQLRIGGFRWSEVLEERDVDAVLLDTEGWPLDEAIRADPAWRLAYEDDVAALFVRT